MMFEDLIDFEHGGLSTECLNIVHHLDSAVGRSLASYCDGVNSESS